MGCYMDNKELFMWQSFSAHVRMYELMSVSAKNPQQSAKKGGKNIQKGTLL